MNLSASELANYRVTGKAASEAQELVAHFETLKQERDPFYLTMSDLDDVLRWKLRGQYGRGRALRGANTDRVLRDVTQAALNVSHPDKEYELELRLGMLSTLRGVSLPVATTVLAFMDPQQYGTLDHRSWRMLFGQERRSFSIAHYSQYLSQVRSLAQDLGWPILDVDLALWAYDRQRNG